MKIYLIYFSPTGGTKKVLDIISAEFHDKENINLGIQNFEGNVIHISDEDLCLIAVPSFGGRVPSVALDRLKTLRGNNAKTILVCTYGNRDYEDTLLELKETAQELGFQVKAALSAVSEHSIMRQFGTGRPDAQDKIALQSFMQTIQDQWHNEKTDICLSGNKPFKEYNGIPLKPKADARCNQCGICAQECPVGAILLEDPSKTIEDQCISCMRCISVCPQAARSLNKVMLALSSKKLKKACSSRKENELFL